MTAFEENFIGINSTSGIPGESGTSLISLENFSSYGVLTFSSNLRHSKLVNWKYYAIENIINISFDITLSSNEFNETLEIFPNPAFNLLNVKSGQLIQDVSIIDMKGHLHQSYFPQSNNFSIRLNELASGVYFIKLNSQNGTTIRKILIK